MGLIKAGIGATGGTLADQWKEYFYCESMSKDVLATKGQKRVIRILSSGCIVEMQSPPPKEAMRVFALKGKHATLVV